MTTTSLTLECTQDVLDRLVEDITELRLAKGQRDGLKEPTGDGIEPISNIIHLLCTNQEELVQQPEFTQIGPAAINTFEKKLRKIDDRLRIPVNRNAAQFPHDLRTITDPKALKEALIDRDLVKIVDVIIDTAPITRTAHEEAAAALLNLDQKKFFDLFQEVKKLGIKKSSLSGLTNPRTRRKNVPIKFIIQLLCTSREELRGRDFVQIGDVAINEIEAALKEIHPDLMIPLTNDDLLLPIELREYDDCVALQRAVIELASDRIGMRGIKTLPIAAEPTTRKAPTTSVAAAHSPANTGPDSHLRGAAFFQAEGTQNGIAARAADAFTGGRKPIQKGGPKRGGGGQLNRRRVPGRSGPR